MQASQAVAADRTDRATAQAGRGGVDGLAVAEDRVDQLLTLPAGREDRGNGPLSPGVGDAATPSAHVAPTWTSYRPLTRPDRLMCSVRCMMVVMRPLFPQKLSIEDVVARTAVDAATWRAYVARGHAPHPNGREIVRGRAQPWWYADAIERWIAGRPGSGYRDRSFGVIYFIEADDGRTIGNRDALPEGQFRTAEMFFNPVDAELPFAGHRLTVRYGHVLEDPVNPALYAYGTFSDDEGNKRLRATYEVQQKLFAK
jgi:hypothetical protein